ncbi:MAG: hypothetical protein ACWA5R_05955 [bacterium]
MTHVLNQLGIPLWVEKQSLNDEGLSSPLIAEDILWQLAQAKRPNCLFMVSEQQGPLENKLLNDLGRALGLDSTALILETAQYVDDIDRALSDLKGLSILALLPEKVQQQWKLEQAHWYSKDELLLCNGGSVTQLLNQPELKRTLWKQLKPLL